MSNNREGTSADWVPKIKFKLGIDIKITNTAKCANCYMLSGVYINWVFVLPFFFKEGNSTGNNSKLFMVS